MTASQKMFSLGTYSFFGSPDFPGIVIDNKVLAMSALTDLLEQNNIQLIGSESTLALLNAWDHNFGVLKQAVFALSDGSEVAKRTLRNMVDLAELDVRPPINLPRQIFCAGANYFKHVVDYIVARGPGVRPGTENMTLEQLRAFAEDLMQKRRESGEPYVFSKPVSSICGAFDPITLLPGAEQPDWELELAVVIGKPALQISEEEAMDYVAGYTIANDISNRGQIFRTDPDTKPMGSDWVSGKGSPGYCPLGPYFVPSEFIDDPMKLNINLALNGEMMQDECTDDMIIGIPRLLAYLTARVQLLPGDLVLTGSPAGNGVHYKRYLQPGDVMDASITHLGAQRNEIKEAELREVD